MPIRFSTHNGKLSCSQKTELPSGLFLLVNVLQNVNFICISVFLLLRLITRFLSMPPLIDIHLRTYSYCICLNLAPEAIEQWREEQVQKQKEI